VLVLGMKNRLLDHLISGLVALNIVQSQNFELKAASETVPSAEASVRHSRNENHLRYVFAICQVEISHR
jgi:hypothetical protein